MMSADAAGAPPGSGECPRLAVVIPCHNEAESLAVLARELDRLAAALAGRYAVEFIFVDDGSTDATWQKLGELLGGRHDFALLRHEKNRGIAAAIATGIAAADSELVASLDADCTYAPLQLAALLARCSEEVDMVVASPYHPLGRVEGVPPWRLALSRSASACYRLVMRNKLHTYTSCVRVYRRSAVVHLPLAHSGFLGIVELLWQLDRRGGTIVECPAVLTARKTGQSKMRLGRTALAHVRFLLRAAWHRLASRVAAPEVQPRLASHPAPRLAP
jgi:dolichol-phosphate mannosyltransferase